MAFNKLPKHRTFSYKPRFYDPKKEEFDRIVKNAKAGKDTDTGGLVNMKDRIRKNYQKKGTIAKAPRKTIMKSNMRVFFIILFLLALTFAILTSNIGNIVELAN